ncbi:MAG: ABC-F family ATP-binding cassette domain-containing protein, partial [Gemmatimonadales bacterium]
SAVIISHDRIFLDNVVDHVLHLEGGTAVAYTGNYQSFGEQRAFRRLSAERAFEKQAKSIAREEDFIRRNLAGQNSTQAVGRRRRLLRLPRLSPPPGEAGAMAVRFDARERGGDQVLTAEGLGIDLGTRTLLDGFSATIRRGDVVGLVGPNGAGKTTLLSVLLGEHDPTRGSCRLGDSIDVAYYRQDLGDVPADRTLFDLVHDLKPHWSRGQVHDHLGRIGFTGDQARRRAGSLSGGEVARVAIGKLMLSGANFLVFDEPTNHLDVETIEVLEDAIDAYPGTVLLVSHDRALLRSLTTRTWALAAGRIEDFPGGYEEWEDKEARRVVRDRQAEAAARAATKDRDRERRSEPASGPRPLTRARRTLSDAETRVHELEARVGDLTAALEAGNWYGSDGAAREAADLARQLETARSDLDAAMTEWESAQHEVDRLEASA